MTVRAGWPPFREWQATHLPPTYQRITAARWRLHDLRRQAAARRRATDQVVAAVAAAGSAFAAAADAMKAISRALALEPAEVEALKAKMRAAGTPTPIRFQNPFPPDTGRLLPSIAMYRPVPDRHLKITPGP